MIRAKIWKLLDNSSWFFCSFATANSNEAAAENKRESKKNEKKSNLSYFCLIVMLSKFVRVLNAKIRIYEPFNSLVNNLDRSMARPRLLLWFFVCLKAKKCGLVNFCMFVYLHMKYVYGVEKFHLTFGSVLTHSLLSL